MVVGGVEASRCPVCGPGSSAGVEEGQGQPAGRADGVLPGSPQLVHMRTAHALNKDLALLTQQSQGTVKERRVFYQLPLPESFVYSDRKTAQSPNTPQIAVFPTSSFMISILLPIDPIKEIEVYFPFPRSLMRLSLFSCLYQPFACSLRLLLLNNTELF